MTRPLALAVSPHLDDAVFSAGGRLARLAREGWRVVIATVFTRSVAHPTGFALACQLDKGLPADLDYMALRRGEDAKACRLLGAEPCWLPFAEAPHRGYDDAAALFGPLRRDDEIVMALRPALSELIETRTPSLVFAPQAIGGHVDHVAVVEALRAIGAAPAEWWSDYPYSARSGPVARPFESLFDAMPDQLSYLDADDRVAKRQAALAYGSQLGFQFGGLAAAQARFSALDHERFRLSSPREEAPVV